MSTHGVASPGPTSLAKCRKVKADLLSEIARGYAHGAANLKDVEQAAREFVAAEQALLKAIGGIER